MKVLYYDCVGGITGDTILGAFIELGVEEKYIKDELDKLNIPSINLKSKKVYGKSISGTSIQLSLDYKDIEDELKDLKSLETIIDGTTLNDFIKRKSKNILRTLIESEARVINSSISEISFSKAIWLNYIVKIVSVLACIDFIKPSRIISSKVEIGGGIRNKEGEVLPLPTPTTAEILRHIPITVQGLNFEAVNEIGAAILINTVDEYVDRRDFIIDKIGYGIGNKENEILHTLRIYQGNTIQKDDEFFLEKNSNNNMKNEKTLDFQYVIECNIDDMNSEHYEFLMTKLFGAGALDVYYTTIIMKKGRPAVKVSVLCSKEKLKEMNEILFLHSTTFGTRCYEVSKNMLQRSFGKVNTKYGEITVKSGYYNGKKIKAKPEYDECKKAATDAEVSINEVYNEVLRCIYL